MVSSEQSDAKFLFQLLPSNVQVARLAHWIIIIYNQTQTRKLTNCICPKKKIVFVQIEKNIFVQIEEKNVFVQNSSLDYNHLQRNRKFCSVQHSTKHASYCIFSASDKKVFLGNQRTLKLNNFSFFHFCVVKDALRKS